MNETEKMQILHQRSVKGESLTANEQLDLQNWYENLDREEDLTLNDSDSVQDIKELRRNLTKITEQTMKVSREVKTLISQNEKTRSENQVLKKSLEARLLEKVA